ncbi:MAG: hypothetical protein RLP44_12735 [Aggregatilineales bacterium]
MKVRIITPVIVWFITLIVTSFGNVQAQTRDAALVAWHPEGVMLAVAYDSRVDIYDIESLEVLNSLSMDEESGSFITPPVWNSGGSQLAVAYGPDVYVWAEPWSPENAEEVIRYQYYEDERGASIRAMAWSPDDTEIAIGVGELVRVWDINSGTLQRQFWDEWGIVNDVLWHGERISIATSATYALNLDPETGAIINYFYTFTEHVTAVKAIDFSPDMTEMVIALWDDGSIRIWGDTYSSEEYNGAPRLTFQHEDVVTDIDWNPQSSLIASTGWDARIIIWDAETGDAVQTISTEVQVNSIAWSPDGTRLAYGVASHTPVIVDISIEE